MVSSANTGEVDRLQPPPTPEVLKKNNLAAEVVSLLYQISIRTEGQELAYVNRRGESKRWIFALEDTDVAARAEWEGMARRSAESLLEIKADLERILAQCGEGWAELFRRRLLSLRIDPSDFCTPVRRVLEAQRAKPAQTTGGQQDDLQDRTSPRDGAGDGSPSA